MRLRKPCEHERYEEHPIGWSDTKKKHPIRWCPGGEFLAEDTLVWLCVERRNDGLAVSNLPGGPNHCFFTGKYVRGKAQHLSDCGYQPLDVADALTVRERDR